MVISDDQTLEKSAARMEKRENLLKEPVFVTEKDMLAAELKA